VLKDGSEIHRIGPPTDVCDYDTGKLIGRIGHRGFLVPLEADPPAVGGEVAPLKRYDVEILDY